MIGPTPRQFLQYALAKLGADGLCNPGGECGCPVSDLATVGDCLDLDECLPARFVPPDDPTADPGLLGQWPEGYYVLMEEAGTKPLPPPFCLWEEYQRTGEYRDMLRWLKHRAYCRVVVPPEGQE